MAIEKIPKKQLKEWGMKLLTKIELKKIDSGTWIDCDTLHQSLLHAGYNARYEKVYEDKAGFLAKFYIDDEYIGSVEGSDLGHMIREWKKRVEENV